MREGCGEQQTERGCRKKNTKYKKREITETGRQGAEDEMQWAGKDSPSTCIPRLYLSKESPVLAQELKPLSHCAGALRPGAPASFGAWGCGAWLALAKLGGSVRDNCQITVLLNVAATGGMICPLSLLPSLFPSTLFPITPGDIRADRAHDLPSSDIWTLLSATCLICNEWWKNYVKRTHLLNGCAKKDANEVRNGVHMFMRQRKENQPYFVGLVCLKNSLLGGTRCQPHSLQSARC